MYKNIAGSFDFITIWNKECFVFTLSMSSLYAPRDESSDPKYVVWFR